MCALVEPACRELGDRFRLLSVMRRALRSLILCAALGAVVMGQEGEQVQELEEVEVRRRELGIFDGLATGAATGAVGAGDASGVTNSLLALAAKNLLDSGWGQTFQHIAEGAQTAKDTQDTQAFLDAVINTASPGSADGHQTLFTMQLNSNPTTNQANFERLYQNFFGEIPTADTWDSASKPENFQDFVNSVQTLVGQASNGISSGNGGLKLDCAWTVRADVDNFNFALPDGNSIYYVHLMQNFGSDDLLVVEGDFPEVRYFSFQTYDDNYNNVDSLLDSKIVAANGTNPFAEPVTDKANNGKFRIYVTGDGKGGFPNEIAAHKNGGSGTAFLMYRLYLNDPNAVTKGKAASLAKWGWVNPPVISYKASIGGLLPTNVGMKLTPLTTCPDDNTNLATDALRSYMELNAPANQSAQRCEAENIKDAFMLFSRDADAASDSRAPFSNSHANYLVACANNRNYYTGSNDLVAVVRNYLPKTPYSKYQARFVGDLVDTDVRYASFSIYDLKTPGPQIATVSDKEFHDFYYDKYGAQTWEDKFGRNVSLVVAKNAETLKRCGISTEKSLTMFLEKTITNADGSEATSEVPQWWGLVYRELVPQRDVINATTSLKDYGLKPSKMYKKSVADAKEVMCPRTKGSTCDSNPWRVGSIMKEHFPRVDWFFCSVDGILTVAPPSANPYDTNYKLSNGPDMDDLYWNQFCEGDVNNALVKAYAPTTLSAHYKQQKANATAANHLLAYPIRVKTSQRKVVVGVSVMASKPEDTFFKGDVSICGYTYVTEPTKWRCTNTPTPDEAWLTADFDDSAWSPAVVLAKEALDVPGIDSTADFITAANPSTITVCRTVIPNPTYLG